MAAFGNLSKRQPPHPNTLHLAKSLVLSNPIKCVAPAALHILPDMQTSDTPSTATQKVAFISGANKGLGLETARQLSQLGYFVFIGARDAAKGEAAAASLGPSAAFVKVDMEDSATFASAAESILAHFGHLDVLVNNAGIDADHGLAPSQAPLAAIRKSFETNAFGLIGLTQAMMPLLRKSPAGRIVNVSSILGSITINSDPNSQIGDWRSFGYNGSKAAVNMFTATLSYELRDTPIKVNSAHPGWVKTELGGDNAPLEVADGAKTSVELATLPADGPTGGFFHLGQTLPW
jgi:NAD(P)-dependent dehydrogenase (short-subunit alcohol dehydrogenase family)